jgi:hydrogenase maturation factor
MMNWVHVNLALKEDIPIDELKDIYKIIKTELGEASVIRDS